jgi:hypothetical protein
VRRGRTAQRPGDRRRLDTFGRRCIEPLTAGSGAWPDRLQRPDPARSEPAAARQDPSNTSIALQPVRAERMTHKPCAGLLCQ